MSGGREQSLDYFGISQPPQSHLNCHKPEEAFCLNKADAQSSPVFVAAHQTPNGPCATTGPLTESVQLGPQISWPAPNTEAPSSAANDSHPPINQVPYEYTASTAYSPSFNHATEQHPKYHQNSQSFGPSTHQSPYNTELSSVHSPQMAPMSSNSSDPSHHSPMASQLQPTAFQTQSQSYSPPQNELSVSQGYQSAAQHSQALSAVPPYFQTPNYTTSPSQYPFVASSGNSHQLLHDTSQNSPSTSEPVIPSVQAQAAQSSAQPQFTPHMVPASVAQQPQQHSFPPQPTSQAIRSNAMPQLYPPPVSNKMPVPQAPTSYSQPASARQLQSHAHPRQPPMAQKPRGSPQVMHDQQRFGTFPRQHSSDRVPGAALTSEEWNALNCPVSLLHDYNFLPSDGPEKPRRPVIMSQVNCHPDFMRCTLTTVPVSSKLQSRCRLPLGLMVHPFRDVNDLPVIQTPAIVRCRSCRIYINPFVKFVDNGRRWRCPVCTLTNTVPDSFYFDPTTQTYGDPSCRPEIRYSTVEFIATSEYMLRPPQAATYVFCLEVSRTAVTTGYLNLVCGMLADQLNKMPGDSRRQVAILTYDSGVQFYILSGKTMRMVICQDLSEVFLPDMDGMVNRINDCAEQISNLLRQLPNEFAQTQDTSNCLGFVLQIALKLIGNTGGRVTVFNTTIPSLGPGALECRETREDLTKPDPEHLRPVSDFYRTIALDFAAAQIAVDLFMLNSKYCDIATISGVARFSGGGVYHYPNFHYDPEPAANATGTHKRASPALCDFVEVENLRRDLLRYLTRKIGFEAVLRLRCTRGLAVQNFYGNFFMRSVDLLNLPIVNPDAGYAIQLEINEKLDSFQTVVLQAALLYTTSFGDRRIRVHTLCLPVTDSPEAVFNYADEGAIACLVAKMAVERTISSGLANAREALTTVMGDILSAYQNERNSGNSPSSLSGICPSSLRLLPSYLCGALRFPAFRNHTSTSLDIRSGALELLIGASAHRMLALMYPRLYAVNSFLSAPLSGKDSTLAQKAASLSLDETSAAALSCLPLTGKSITRDGVFLLDTGSFILLLVGFGLSAADLTSLIGYSNLEDLTVEKAVTELGGLPDGATLPPPPRKRLQTLIKSIRRDRSLGTALILIRHDVPEPLKSLFINALVEDRTATAPSYSEYVQMILYGKS
uniref:Protein transport protein Sec24C n=1 Tax=Mesocestoides corti TaxID=53468 RepID=A0A5K3FLL6_MESCO